ncbi:MAG: hypothetical protein ACEQSR_02170 [Candidatus Methylacidiphilales bacterium]
MTAILNKKPIKTNFRNLMNMSFVIKKEKVYVIEANPCSNRTVPSIANVYGIANVNIVAKIN